MGEVEEVEEVKEVKEIVNGREGADVGWMEEGICGFGEDNMKDSITELARE